jgi:hypothetical protein
MFPLVSLNAVLAGGTWTGVMHKVVARIVVGNFYDVVDLRKKLPSIIRECWSEFLLEAEELEINPDLCVFFLFEQGRAWLLGQRKKFEPVPLPAGLWCDPPINDDGGCKVEQTFRGDAHMVEIMRQQRATREKASGFSIGGYVTRATITSDGIALARIGDLEEPAAASQTTTKPTRKVGRNEPCPCGSGRKAKRCCQA